MQQYHVYGHCPKFDETCLLHSAWTEKEAVDWARGYTRHGDMGGWTKIYVTYRTQVDVDWENDPVHDETILWSCWREPMPWSDNAMEEF